MKKACVTFLFTATFFIFFSGPVQADSLMLAASDFVPGQPNHPDLDCYTGWELYNYSGAGYRYFFAPVHLPQGAQVTSIVVYYQDNSSGYIDIFMERYNMYTLNCQQMGQLETSGEMSGFRNSKISPISYWTINNEGYVYWMKLWFSDADANTDLTIYGIKINYNAP